MRITRNLSVCPLLDITDPEFSKQYELGVWWALYGDFQGQGPYEDTYLIENISWNIRAGRFSELSSPWFAHVGFYLGMLHGGWLIRPSGTLVVLTDPDFTNGYRVGRDYYFTEATEQPTDTYLIEHIHSWVLEYQTWHEPLEVLCYALGCRIGELSGTVIPQTEAVAERQIARLYR